jgi:hypothetical protein
MSRPDARHATCDTDALETGEPWERLLRAGRGSLPMRRTEFVAVGCADLTTYARSLEAEGWEPHDVRPELILALGVEGATRAFRHPDVPHALLLAEGATGLRATAVAIGDGKGYEWFEMVFDIDYQIDQVESCPRLFDTVELVAAGGLPEYDGLGLS